MKAQLQSLYYEETPHAVLAVKAGDDGLVTLNGTNKVVRLYNGQKATTEAKFGVVEKALGKLVVTLYPDTETNLSAETMATMLTLSAQLLDAEISPKPEQYHAVNAEEMLQRKLSTAVKLATNGMEMPAVNFKQILPEAN